VGRVARPRHRGTIEIVRSTAREALDRAEAGPPRGLGRHAPHLPRPFGFDAATIRPPRRGAIWRSDYSDSYSGQAADHVARATGHPLPGVRRTC